MQTLSTAYASEVVPTVLRPYVTAYVCMCWGAGILLSSGVVRAVASIEGDLGWRLPFVLQWIWPVPLFIGAYFAPESPWNAVRRNKFDLARKSLMALQQDGPDKERTVDVTLAYIRHTTELEKGETSNASFLECFKGANLRRTEIVSIYVCRFTRFGSKLTVLRTVSSGQPRSCVAMPSSAMPLPSSKRQASPSFRPSM